VIRDIPRVIEDVDEVKVLVIDDGSRDKTAEVAYAEGADYVLRLPYTQGLARAFSAGINRCLELGADIIVNTDGDHQYEGKDIPKLIRPILAVKADIVIGDRQVRGLAHFSLLKKCLQKLGSRTVGLIANVRVPDATSGFRAYSREAALRLNVFSKFTYTLETIIQAGKNQMAVAHVPIQANAATRESRLFATIPTYLKRSIATILRIYALYEPLRTLFYMGGAILAVGLVGILRFLFYWLTGDGAGHIQSLVISAALLIMGVQVWVLGIIADLISVNRRLGEELLYRMKKYQTLVSDEVALTSANTSQWRVPSEEKVSEVV
jgi:glycosyltransferase involved in cell wall biosynthesis